MFRTYVYAALFSTLTTTSLSAQPTWSQIMTILNSSGDASGNFYNFNAYLNSSSPTVVNNTDTTDNPSMVIPTDGTGNPETTWLNDNVSPCSSSSSYPSYWTGGTSPSRSPQQFLRSNYGPPSGTYKGLTFYGAFNVAAASSGGGNIVESSFFHEQPCFSGGREYGVQYNFNNSTLSFYASTYTNCVGNCGSNNAAYVLWNVPTTGTYANILNQNNYFEIWPQSITASPYCGFNLAVVGPPPNYTTLWSSPATSNVPNSSITTEDSSFCTAILNEQGYTTTGISYDPTITGLASYLSSISLGIQGVYVGR